MCAARRNEQHLNVPSSPDGVGVRRGPPVVPDAPTAAIHQLRQLAGDLLDGGRVASDAVTLHEPVQTLGSVLSFL